MSFICSAIFFGWTEMKLIKIIIYFLGIHYFHLFTTVVNAEEINFNGNISEYSCSSLSSDRECKEVIKTINKIKEKNNAADVIEVSNHTFNITTEPTSKKFRNIVTINYH